MTFSGEEHSRRWNAVRSLMAAQEVYFDTFQGIAKPEQREFYNRTMSGNAIDTVVKMRDLVKSGGLSGEMKGLDASSWFDAATARFGQRGTMALTNLIACYAVLAYNMNAYELEAPAHPTEKPLPA